jgi:hypothetical protein
MVARPVGRRFGPTAVFALLLAVAVAAGVAHAAPTAMPIDLGTLGGASSSACAINANGEIAGTSDTATGESHATLWLRRG